MMSWYDNIKEWTGMQYEQATRMAMDRESGGLMCHLISKDKEHVEGELDCQRLPFHLQNVFSHRCFILTFITKLYFPESLSILIID